MVLTYVAGGALPPRGALALECVALVVAGASVVACGLVALTLAWRWGGSWGGLKS